MMAITTAVMIFGKPAMVRMVLVGAWRNEVTMRFSAGRFALAATCPALLVPICWPTIWRACRTIPAATVSVELSV